MAELRIHDQSSIYFKSIRTGETPKDINVKIPDKSGWLITDTTLQEILNSGANIASSQILKPDITETPLVHPEAYADILPIASYRTNDTFVGEHQATEWVASLVPDFSTIIDSTADPLFRDGWYPAVNEANRKVYVKYRFISEDICSPFSDALEFTTPEGGVAIPTLSVVEDGSTPLIKGSEFRVFGNLTGVTHVGSSWEITKVSDGTKVKTISNSPDYLREYKVEDGILQPETEYKITLVYHTSHPVFNKTRKVIGTYKTPASTIGRPTLTFNTSEGRYEINGSPFVVSSGTDRHKFTTWVVKNGTGSVVYREENNKELTRLNLTGILEPDNDYRVTAVYIGDKSKSNEGAINFRTPAEDQSNLNKLITITKEANGDVKLVMEKFKMPVAENLLYLTWTIQNYNNNNPIALEVRLDKELDDKYDQELVYDMQPAESWLKWMPNNEIVNPVITLSAKGRVVGEKTVLNYATQIPTECRFDYVLGDMSIEDNDSLSPLIKITDATGADSSWISKRGVIWELYGRDSLVPVLKATGTDYDQHRFTNIDYATNYTVKCTYKTNFGNWTKTFDFRSRPFTLPKPIVTVDPVGVGAKIRATGENLNIPNHPEKSHGSTTWTLYSNTGIVLWQSIKNTADLLSIDIPRDKLERATDYKVGVIFHSVDDTISSVESVVNYSHIGIIYVVKDEDFVSGTNDNVLLRYNSYVLIKKLYRDVGNGLEEETDASQVGFDLTIKDGNNDVWTKDLPFHIPPSAYVDEDDVGKLPLDSKRVDVFMVPDTIDLDPSKTYTLKLNTYITNNGNKIVSSTLTKNFTVLNTAKMGHIFGNMAPFTNNYLLSGTEFNPSYGTSALGGIFVSHGRIKTPHVIQPRAEIDMRGTFSGLRDYTGEWGNPSNRLKNNGDRNNAANHFGWIKGQRVSKKGNFYEALINQDWNQYDPETDTSAWKLITKDEILPSSVEVLDCMGLNWGVGEGTDAFSYSDRKWSDGTTIRDLLISPLNAVYVKMLSPTTKKPCYLMYGQAGSDFKQLSGITNMCWNDIVARQPEYTEVDRYTIRFGTQLYYVRIPTREEAELLIKYCAYTGFYSNNLTNIPFCQSTGVNNDIVKALSYKDNAGVASVEEKDINVKSRVLELCLVLTPIPSGSEPYQTAILNKLYPNMTLPQGNLSWSTESLTEGPDTNYFPSGLKLAYDRFTDTGYFGRIPVGTFKSYKKLMDTYGVSGRTQHYDGTGTNDKDVKFYDMFYYHGLVIYIPNGAPWSNMSFDYCKSQGILFGTNMGTYHSYAGDAKLEDSKDNWYRISGLNISRWNIEPNYGVWNPPRLIPFQDLRDNNIGYLNNDKAIWSYCYSKVLNFSSAPYSFYSMWSLVPQTGRNFGIKDRNVFEVSNISSSVHEISKSAYVGAGGGSKKWSLHITRPITNTIELTGDYPDFNTTFRPMLTLKPVGGGVINKFTLKVSITRYLTIISASHLYRLDYAVSFLEGNESIIAERKYGYRIGRHGLDVADSAEYVSRAVANQYIVATNPPNVIAVNVEHGGINISGNIGCWWKLINGKCLYIPSFHALPGMEQDWRSNGGVTTSIVTFTEADAYTI